MRKSLSSFLSRIVFDKVPEAGVDEELFVVAEAVEIVEDRILFCFFGVERVGKDNAVRDGAGEDFGGERVAFDAAGCGKGGGGEEEKEKSGEWPAGGGSGERRGAWPVTCVPRPEVGGKTQSRCLDPSTAQPDAPDCGAEEKVGLLRSG